MARDKGRQSLERKGADRAGHERIVQEQFGAPWEEIELELRARQRELKREVDAWEAWKALGAVVRRIERVAVSDLEAPTKQSENTRESIGRARAATEQAARQREWRDAFPHGLGIIDEEGAHYRMPVSPPPGHPRLHNKSYLESWIEEFSLTRLLEWRGDDLPQALNSLRRRIGDHQCIEELLKESEAGRWPRSLPLPEAPEEDTQWLVFLFEARILSFAPDPQRVSNEAIAAVYELLNESRASVESLKKRIAKARERYRAGQAGPENAPRPRRRDNK